MILLGTVCIREFLQSMDQIPLALSLAAPL